MEVTVLGCHAPFPPAGGACNGYLIRSGETTVLVDGGPGVAARLMEFGGVDRLNAVLISHLHEDHISDVHCLQHAVFASMRTGRRQGPLPVYAPTEPATTHRWLTPVAPGLLDIQALPTATGLQIGSLAITFVATSHTVPCWAMRVTDGRATWFYSSDTNVEAEGALRPYLAGVDLAFLEASALQDQAERYRSWGHMTAGDAAGLGLRSGAKRVLLTHLHPSYERAQILAEARSVWPAIDLVEEQRTYHVGE